MTDDLRTRIATTMLKIFNEDQTLTIDMGAWIVADAVIAAIFPADWSVDDCRCQLRYTDWTSHG